MGKHRGPNGLREGRGAEPADSTLTYGYVTGKLAERQNVMRLAEGRKELMCPTPL